MPRATAPQPSPRVAYIRDRRAESFDRSEIPTRDACYRASFSEHPGEIEAVKFACGFRDFLANKKILIQEYDLLAGFAFRYTYETTSSIGDDRDFDPAARPPIWPDANKEVENCIRFHGYEEGSAEAKALWTFARGTKSWLYKHYEWGHTIAGYERILNVGFGGLIEEGKKSLTTADETGREFIRAMLITNEAAGSYIERYGRLAATLAEGTENPEYRANMRRIADACGRIAFGPATSFFEAVQLLWLTHEMILAEMMAGSYSLGRLDRYLYPFFERDIAEGKIDEQEASDLIDALWIKLSAHRQSYQNVTLGGVDEKGGYLFTPLTRICLRATRRMRFDQPLLSLRCHASMPEDAWGEAMELLRLGMGFPAFFNDDACIKAKERAGLSHADAANYGIVGCVEPVAQGKEHAKTEVLRVNWCRVLELMLREGKSAFTDDVFPPFHNRDLDEIQTFGEFYDWYKAELRSFTELALFAIDRIDEMAPWVYPTPFLSSTMEGCYRKGRDVTGGGTLYNNTALNAAGMANIADSLAAIKKLVFDEKRYALRDFRDATRANFEGWEELLHSISRCPRYGNDDETVDRFVTELVELYADIADNTKDGPRVNPRGGRYQAGLYTVDNHAEMGMRTGALPDGRLAGEALANAISPAQGRDNTAPTAAINSVLRTDLSVASNGMVFDLKFSPKFLASERHTAALRALITSFFERGGLEIQFNVVDRETLLDAQLHPEKHKDLIVRVSGFSAYFVTINKAGQDELIKRTQYEAV